MHLGQDVGPEATHFEDSSSCQIEGLPLAYSDDVVVRDKIDNL